jgi:hypothetical protein
MTNMALALRGGIRGKRQLHHEAAQSCENIVDTGHGCQVACLNFSHFGFPQTCIITLGERQKRMGSTAMQHDYDTI